MKRLFLGWMILAVLGVVLLAGGAALFGTEIPPNAGFWKRINGVLSPRNSGDSVAITSPNPSTIPNLESGVSLYQINGDTHITSSGFNRVYYIAGLAASPKVQLDPPTDASPFVTVVDLTKAGNGDSGVSVWSNAGIWTGTGSSFTSGDTEFCTSGNTQFQKVYKAVPNGSGGFTWKLWSSTADVDRRP